MNCDSRFMNLIDLKGHCLICYRPVDTKVKCKNSDQVHDDGQKNIESLEKNVKLGGKENEKEKDIELLDPSCKAFITEFTQYHQIPCAKFCMPDTENNGDISYPVNWDYLIKVEICRLCRPKVDSFRDLYQQINSVSNDIALSMCNADKANTCVDTGSNLFLNKLKMIDKHLDDNFNFISELRETIIKKAVHKMSTSNEGLKNTGSSFSTSLPVSPSPSSLTPTTASAATAATTGATKTTPGGCSGVSTLSSVQNKSSISFVKDGDTLAPSTSTNDEKTCQTIRKVSTEIFKDTHSSSSEISYRTQASSESIHFAPSLNMSRLQNASLDDDGANDGNSGHCNNRKRKFGTKSSRPYIQRNFECAYCKYKCDHEKGLKLHFIQTHTLLQCAHCQEISNLPEMIALHELNCYGDFKNGGFNGLKKFSCPRCSLGFQEVDEYKNHFKKTHTNLMGNSYLLRCVHCESTFVNAESFKMHAELCKDTFSSGFLSQRNNEVESEHVENVVEPFSDSSGSENERVGDNRLYKCSACTLRFASFASLEMHMLSHNVNLLSCNTCCKIFDSKKEMANHKTKFHSGKIVDVDRVSDDELGDNNKYLIKPTESTNYADRVKLQPRSSSRNALRCIKRICKMFKQDGDTNKKLCRQTTKKQPLLNGRRGGKSSILVGKKTVGISKRKKCSVCGVRFKNMGVHMRSHKNRKRMHITHHQQEQLLICNGTNRKEDENANNGYDSVTLPSKRTKYVDNAICSNIAEGNNMSNERVPTSGTTDSQNVRPETLLSNAENHDAETVDRVDEALKMRVKRFLLAVNGSDEKSNPIKSTNAVNLSSSAPLQKKIFHCKTSFASSIGNQSKNTTFPYVPEVITID